MEKKFELSSFADVSESTLSCDGVVFVKSTIEPFSGLMLCNTQNIDLPFSFSFDFQLTDLVFSDLTIENEFFRCVSCSSPSSTFEYIFDNDEMFAQFCEFYGLES